MAWSRLIGVALIVAACAQREHDTFCPPGTDHYRPRDGFPYDYCQTAAHEYEGPYRAYGSQGTNALPREEGTYHHNEKDGHWIVRYENGLTQQEGDYKVGVIVGEWKRYDRDGRLSQVTHYDEHGKLHGLAIEWFAASGWKAECYDHDGRIWTADRLPDADAARAKPCP